MQSLSLYTQALGQSIIFSSLKQGETKDIDGVLLYKNSKNYSDSVIYIADAGDMEALLKETVLPDNLFISCNKKGIDFNLIKTSNLVVSSMSTLDLFATVNEKVTEYHKWERVFSNPQDSPSYMEWLVNTAYEICHSSIYVLNVNFQIDFAKKSPDDNSKFSRELLRSGCLPKEELAEAFNGQSEQPGNDYLFIPDLVDCDGLFCHVRRLKSKGLTVGYVIILSSMDNQINIRLLSYHLGKNLVLFSTRQDIDCLLSGQHLQSILGAILSNKITDSTVLFRQIEPDILNAQSNLGYVVIVTEFQNENASFAQYRLLAKQIQKALNHSSSFVYEGRMITIVTHIPIKPQSYAKIFSDESATLFKNTLLQYNAYACISIQTSRYDMLRTMFESAKRMLRISRSMEAQTDNRLFFAEDNIMFVSIDLAAERFSEVYGHNDLMFINNPNVMQLYRYDKENKQNLTVILFQYLLNACDINRTAAATFMHRNTLRRKIDQIKQIANINFSDGSQNAKYLFALLSIKYYENCMGKKYEAK